MITKTFQEQLSPKKLHMEMQEVRQTGLDYSLSEHLSAAYDGMTVEQFYAEMGLEPSRDTVSLILDRQDEAYRWLVPEIIRDAIRKGFINQPIFNDLIARDEAIAQPSQVMPYWDMSALKNEPKDLGVAESMELGSIKYGQKTVRISKTGIGIEMADECIQYTPLSLLSIFLSDVGVKLGSSLGKKAITTLINGEQADGSESAGTVGIKTQNALAYEDFIRFAVRGSLLNRKWTKMVGDEDSINTVLNLPEFRPSNKTGNPELGVNVKTPVPKSYDAYCHSSVPTKKLIMLDSNFALVKLTAQPLRVEAERIVARQVNGTYVSLTTGFAILFRDGRLLMDTNLAYNANQWPTYMAPLF